MSAIRCARSSGASFLVWALHALGSTGWEDVAVALVDRYRAQPDFGERASPPSYWMGESGIALVAHRLTGHAAPADRMHELVLTNLDSGTSEVMWGGARDDARRRGDACVDGRAALGRGVADLSRAGPRRARRGRPLDAADLRAGDAVSRPRSRLCRQRPRAREPRCGSAARRPRAVPSARRRAGELAAGRGGVAGRRSRPVVPRGTGDGREPRRPARPRALLALHRRVGLALFLRDLLGGEDRFPTMGLFA